MTGSGGYRNYTVRARRIARLLDVAAMPLLPLLRSWAPRGAVPDRPRSILVVRLDHLGDVLMSTPALSALRRAFPEAQIDVLAAPWGQQALAGNPDVSSVLTAAAPWYDPSLPAAPGVASSWRLAKDLGERSYDWGFDFRGDPRVILCHLLPGARRRFGFSRLGLERLLTDALPYERRRSMLDLCLDLIALAGVAPTARRPVFAVRDEDRESAARILSDAGLPADCRPAIVAPSANRAQARWTTSGFAKTVDGLRAQGQAIALVGRADDAPVTSEVRSRAERAPVDLTGRTTLGQLAAILERACILVGNDSGPAHLAAAVGCPTVAVFGPTDPELTFPYEDGTRFVSVRSPIDHARPCLDPQCRSDHGFPALGADEVLAAARRVLSEVVDTRRNR